jgi:hypothetical protein
MRQNTQILVPKREWGREQPMGHREPETEVEEKASSVTEITADEQK